MTRHTRHRLIRYGLLASPLVGLILLGHGPGVLPALYLGMSLLTFSVYAVDKRRARQGGNRVPEATLHLLEFLGGWPGALLAQEGLRHKSSKASYRYAFHLMVCGNGLLAGALMAVAW